MKRPLLLTLVTLLSLASGVGAQIAVGATPRSLTHPGADTAPAQPVPPPEFQVPIDESYGGNFTGTLLGSTIGSTLGLVGGALLGFAASNGQLTNGAAVLTLGGSVVGAGIGGGIPSGRGDLAFLGSLLGAIAGTAFVAAYEPDGVSGLLSYSLIQGLTTAFVAGR